MTALALAVLLAQNPAATGERSMVSKCAVETDTEWGYTKAKPIKVGGSPLYGPARQRQFLQALVGPGGQPITFKRRGSLPSGDDRIILDLYEVSTSIGGRFRARRPALSAAPRCVWGLRPRIRSTFTRS